MKHLTLAIAVYLILIPAGQATNLTFWDSEQAKVVVRSMDLHESDSPQLRASPSGILRIGDITDNHMIWQSTYGSVALMGFRTHVIVEGINDQGLSVHALPLDKTNYGERNHEIPGLPNTLWVQYLLDNCKTVNEALASLDQYQIIAMSINEQDWPIHLALQDASGDAAIIEFMDGLPIIFHGPEYSLTQASMNLPEREDPFERRTTVVDLSNKTYYFASSDNPNIIWIDLNKINFKKDSTVKMLDPAKIKVAGDVSKHFK